MWPTLDSVLKRLCCAVPLLLAAPAALAQASGAAGAAPSAAAGRELFGVHCARCHGADAGGTPDAPDLRQRVRGMSETAFVNAVLRRYRWTLPATGAGGETAARDALIRGVLAPQQGPGTMPAWESQPAVAQGIRSLYAYLGAAAR